MHLKQYAESTESRQRVGKRGRVGKREKGAEERGETTRKLEPAHSTMRTN